MVYLMVEVGLIALLLVGLYFIRVKTDMRILYTADKQELDINNSAGIFGMKLYAVKEGDCKEFSVAFKLIGDLLVLRLDLPVAAMVWKGLEPVISVFREVEVGIGEAKPVDQGGARIALSRLLAIIGRMRQVGRVLLPGIRHLGSKTSVDRLDLSIAAGTGSAPSTAISVGSFWLVSENAIAYISKKVRLTASPRVRIAPDFNNRVFRFEARADSSFRQGELLTAFLLLVSEAVKWAIRAARSRKKKADNRSEGATEGSLATS